MWHCFRELEVFMCTVLFFVLRRLTVSAKALYIHLYSPIYMVAEIRKTATTTERKKERNLTIAPMTSIP